MWNWLEFTRVGYLDADMCVVANIDELLEKPMEELAPMPIPGVPTLLAVQVSRAARLQ